MQTRRQESDETVKIVIFIISCMVLFIGGIGGCMRYWPEYNIWQQGMEGAAQLSKAEQNRQIIIEQAKANYEAAKLNANAEVERAKGAAMANEIMSKSLGGPENYLRWRYIHMLEQSESTNREIIYIPVEGLLPITEAGRATKK